MSVLLTKANRRALLKNGTWNAAKAREGKSQTDFKPVVKLFTPDAGATWLISEMDPEDQDRLFGLCDLGLGSPELGYVSLAELMQIRGQLRLPVERDRWFTPTKTISQYADEARNLGRIKA